MSSITPYAERILAGGTLNPAEALQIYRIAETDLLPVLDSASRIRDHYFGTTVRLCAIINAKSGRCPEDCAFCAQSIHHSSGAPVYPLVDGEQIVAGARAAAERGATCYGIVTSGTTIKPGQELDVILSAVRRIREEIDITPSCSLGIIDDETALLLKEAGVGTYHHNLETAASFFPHICTTHPYDRDLDTVRAAKNAGLSVCSGGIMGLGESSTQRIELAFTLRDLAVDSIPLNFLTPVAGTRLAKHDVLTPRECLATIALFRHILPDRQITVCGGREHNLRDLQSWIFFAGANGVMIGDYLTTSGRETSKDLQMIADLGLAPVSAGKGYTP